ncbi:glycosyltransferase [Arthrobacter livingstonensis]|uniref:Glycosyltransferase n=1 Tax=Arthrobacter livingstonensis TaxID=670078 RepID=A0A2V5M123_9MICC|nr:glycosyltransferase [Arthrobacter livingstonensis]PYI68836.1 glycosyltransferase [Arthrobacter livingstonensis]
MQIDKFRKILWHFRAGGFRQLGEWRRRELLERGIRNLGNARGSEGIWSGRRARRRLQFRPSSMEPASSVQSNINAAVILDDFSAAAFSFEWNCTLLSPKIWRQQMEDSNIDLLFVESAWSGPDRLWAGKLAGASANLGILTEVINWCKESGVPTVFWNKEDPAHYADFIGVAKLFDQVFTTDSNRLPDYIRDLGHSRVDVLPFAAQPALHNPIRPRDGWRSRDVAFAGMYFAEKFPGRRDQLDMLLSAAADASEKLPIGLEIFSRQLGGAAKYQFPEIYSGKVVGSLNYSQMLTAYKAYRIFLNVNTVVDSPSMCSRRIFEIVAAGSNIVTTASPAIESLFTPDEIFTVRSREEASDLMVAIHRNPQLGDRQLHRAQRKIWSQHTYRHRSDQILRSVTLDLADAGKRPTVSALVSTIRPHQLEHVFRTVATQLDVDVELVLLTHGFAVSSHELASLKGRYQFSNVTLLTAPRHQSLGACLNDCVRAASGQVLTKVDDDDYYAPHYLSDQLYALEYSGADIVGKQAHYMHLADHGATLFRFPDREHVWTRSVMGPTIMGHSRVFVDHPFADVGRGEDSRFLESVLLDNGTIYSADRYNYCQQRAGNGHTWQVSDMNLLAGSDLRFFGNYQDEISV